MATWDYHNFDNDAAADFAETFRQRPNEAVLYEALATVAEEEGQIEAADASQALAAAELVAAIIGRPAADMPVGLLPATTLLDADGQEDLQELAQEAVEAVLRDSELREKWAASENYADWQALQQNLLTRLQFEE